MGCVKKEEGPPARISSKWRARVCVCVCVLRLLSVGYHFFMTLINLGGYRPCLRRSLNLFSLYFYPRHFCFVKRKVNDKANKIGDKTRENFRLCTASEPLIKMEMCVFTFAVCVC
jgi:hypothetical protein